MSPTDSRQGAMLDANCPRCGAGFECGANAGRCDCFGIRLTDAWRAELAARYPDRCLCMRCLRDVMSGAEPQPPVAGPRDARG